MRVPPACMPETREPNLLSRRSRWRSKSSQASHGLGDSGLGVAANTNAWSALWVSQLVQLSQHVEQVAFEVDVSGHVCASEAQLVRCPDQSAEGPPRPGISPLLRRLPALELPSQHSIRTGNSVPSTASTTGRRTVAASIQPPDIQTHRTAANPAGGVTNPAGRTHARMSKRRTAFRTSTIDHSTGLSAPVASSS